MLIRAVMNYIHYMLCKRMKLTGYGTNDNLISDKKFNNRRKKGQIFVTLRCKKRIALKLRFYPLAGLENPVYTHA